MTTEATSSRAPEDTDDLLNGLYLNDNVPQWKVTDADGAEHILVPAQTFMEMQRERDQYRRTLALINAWRTTEFWWQDPDRLNSLLEHAGMTYEDGKVMDSLVRFILADTDR